MSAKKWFAGIFSILLLIAPAFTQNRGEPGKNPPHNPPENPQGRPVEKPADNPSPPPDSVPPKDGFAPGTPQGNPPENPQGNPPEKPAENQQPPQSVAPSNDKRDFYNFRGYRKIRVNDSIEVVNAYVYVVPSSSFFLMRKTNNEDDKKEIEIYLQFNQSINPRSLTSENVLINDESLPPESQVLFNKNSDVITIKIIPNVVQNETAEDSVKESDGDDETPTEEESAIESVYKIELNNVTSMDGKVREHITVDNFKQSKAKKN